MGIRDGKRGDPDAQAISIPHEVWRDRRLTLRQRMLFGDLYTRGRADTPERLDFLVTHFQACEELLDAALRVLRILGYDPLAEGAEP